MKLQSLILISTITMASNNLWASSKNYDVIERLDMSSGVLHSIVKTPDRGMLEEVLTAARCIFVIPLGL